ncbi:serine hydrolase-like protein [Leptinotarsa decemlineata]|uniref:serine hydrolase-like protein n=1 Tax=Leptinotarsa decemlineata TaxID=7539 RepID=UPI003D30A622
MTDLQSRSIKEFNIPVPWGHIAVKAWGEKTEPHVFVVHGRMDNAGAFDQLIPLLPREFYYVCIDLPGHGRSSHFPPHLPIHSVDFLIAYRLILEHFRKNRVIFLGHSYGGQLAFLFSRLYPEKVEKIILIDIMRLHTVEVSGFKKYLTDRIEGQILLEKKMIERTQPTYTYEEARSRISLNRYNDTLTPEAADRLLKRCLEPADEGRYTFTMDQRMKRYMNPLHDLRFSMESLEHDPVVCPVLIILGNTQTVPPALYKGNMEGLKKLGNVSFEFMEGGHDAHNKNPEIMAPYICKFLSTEKGKL